MTEMTSLLEASVSQGKMLFMNALQTMDISTMTSGDASFSAPFKLVATRNDFIHALVAYFDVAFSKCHKPTGFSTGMRGYFCFHIEYFKMILDYTSGLASIHYTAIVGFVFSIQVFSTYVPDSFKSVATANVCCL